MYRMFSKVQTISLQSKIIICKFKDRDIKKSYCAAMKGKVSSSTVVT